MIFLTSGKTSKLTIVFWKKYNMDNAFFVQKKTEKWPCMVVYHTQKLCCAELGPHSSKEKLA